MQLWTECFTLRQMGGSGRRNELHALRVDENRERFLFDCMRERRLVVLSQLARSDIAFLNRSVALCSTTKHNEKNNLEMLLYFVFSELKHNTIVVFAVTWRVSVTQRRLNISNEMCVANSHSSKSLASKNSTLFIKIEIIKISIIIIIIIINNRSCQEWCRFYSYICYLLLFEDNKDSFLQFKVTFCYASSTWLCCHCSKQVKATTTRKQRENKLNNNYYYNYFNGCVICDDDEFKATTQSRPCVDERWWRRWKTVDN